MRLGERHHASLAIGFHRARRGRRRETSGWHREHHREHVLGAMLQFLGEKALALRCFPSSVMSREIERSCELAVGTEDRRDLHVPIARVAFRSVGGAAKTRGPACAGGCHRRLGLLVAFAGPGFRPGQPFSAPKSSTSITRLPPSLMNCRRPSRSSNLMQSPQPERTPRSSSSLPTRSALASPKFLAYRFDGRGGRMIRHRPDRGKEVAMFPCLCGSSREFLEASAPESSQLGRPGRPAGKANNVLRARRGIGCRPETMAQQQVREHQQASVEPSRRRAKPRQHRLCPFSRDGADRGRAGADEMIGRPNAEPYILFACSPCWRCSACSSCSRWPPAC